MSSRPNSFNRMDYGVETIKRQIGCVRLVGHRSACGRRLSLALPVTWTAPLQLRYAAWGARQEYYNTFAYALLLFLWFFRYLHFCVRWSWSNVYSVPGPDLSGCMEEVGDQGTGFSSNRSPSTMSLFSLPHRPPSTFSCSFLTRLICSILSCHPQPLVNSSLDVWRNFLSSTSPETRTPLPPRASTQRNLKSDTSARKGLRRSGDQLSPVTWLTYSTVSTVKHKTKNSSYLTLNWLFKQHHWEWTMM